MRFLLPLLAVLSVLAAAVSPHAHAGQPHPEDRCPACVVRGAEPAGAVTPDLVAPAAPDAAQVPTPGPAPVCGAPQGAVPGQSPPAVA